MIGTGPPGRGLHSITTGPPAVNFTSMWKAPLIMPIAPAT